MYAGGPEDGWDIRRLLADASAAEVAQVTEGAARLPHRCRRFWERLLDED